MKRIRTAMMAVLLAIGTSAFADDYAYLTIDQTGSETSFVVDDINRITFDESNMVLHLNSGGEQKLPLSTLTKMFFSQSGTNGISALGTRQSSITMKDGVLRVSGAQGSVVTVYDVSGKTVRTVTAMDAETELNLNGLVKGVYIVKVGGEAKKVMNK